MFPKTARLFVFFALILALSACNLPSQEAGPFPTEASATALPDLAATMTAIVNDQTMATVTSVVATEQMATVTAVAATQQQIASATSAAATQQMATITSRPPTTAPQQGGIPVVQITPIATLGQQPRPSTAVPTVPVQTGSTTRILFDRFATSKVIYGNLAQGETKSFVLQVGGGQILMVDVGSPNSDVFLRIIAQNGSILLDSGMGIGQTGWQGRIFVTQDITVQVISRGAATSFTLNTIIPEVITFAPGAISAERGYPIAARDVHSFTLRAMAGQTMSVSVESGNGTMLLGIYGYDDGQPYKRSSVGESNFSFELPSTQDYVIQVVSATDAPADFYMKVTVQ
jgi:hypothetical protein